MVDSSALTIARTIDDTRRLVARWRAERSTIGIVPTMGALHAGHFALVDRARAENDRVLVTLFVNPLQFGPAEDFAAYPRDDAGDFASLTARGCDAVFAPAVTQMFPDGNASLDATPTRVGVPALASVLCGRERPGHFDGVATIVLKLLLIAQPDTAYFGEKDYQQLTIVKRLVRDLCVPVHITGVPTVREADGLALSSRNRYLSGEQRAIAPALHRMLRTVRDALREPDADADRLTQWAARRLRAAGFDRVEYLTLASADTLQTQQTPEPPSRLFAAAWLGATRLIDNLPVTPAGAAEAGG